MLLACDTDLTQPGLKRRIEHVLQQKGKVILLASKPVGRPAQAAENRSEVRPSQSVPTSESLSSQDPQLKTEAKNWLKLQLSKIVSASDAHQLTESVAWQSRPLMHAQLSVGEGVIVVLPIADRLQNANFTPPEISPDGVQSKWQRQFYHWLFEQP